MFARLKAGARDLQLEGQLLIPTVVTPEHLLDAGPRALNPALRAMNPLPGLEPGSSSPPRSVACAVRGNSAVFAGEAEEARRCRRAASHNAGSPVLPPRLWPGGSRRSAPPPPSSRQRGVTLIRSLAGSRGHRSGATLVCDLWNCLLFRPSCVGLGCCRLLCLRRTALLLLPKLYEDYDDLNILSMQAPGQ